MDRGPTESGAAAVLSLPHALRPVHAATDPSWTPLFLIAGGIVLEEGGPLSHAAIVAREFGLPAVLNVTGAMRHLEEGSEVEVDGTAGVVIRIAALVGAE